MDKYSRDLKAQNVCSLQFPTIPYESRLPSPQTRRGYNNVFQAVSLLHHQQVQDKVYGPQRQAWSSDRKGKGVQEMGLLVCDPRRQDRKVWGCEESQLVVHPFQPLGGPRQATQPLPTWVIHL